jgi:hypothetical protein
MKMADALKDSPLRFTVTNGITMDVEITKSDLKTIASKNTQDNVIRNFVPPKFRNLKPPEIGKVK